MKVIDGNIYEIVGLHLEHHQFDNQNSTLTHLFKIGDNHFYETFDIFQQFLMVIYVNNSFKIIALGGIFADAYKYYKEESKNYDASCLINIY